MSREKHGPATSRWKGIAAFSTAIFRDRRAERAVAKALQQSEAMLKESQRVASLGHYSLDVSSGIWTSSEMLDEIFGIDEDYGKTVEGWMEIVHPDDHAEILDYFTKYVLASGNPFNKEYRIVRINDGRERWVHGLGNLKFDSDGQPLEMFGVIQDITGRKQAEDALQVALKAAEDEREKNVAIVAGIGDGISIQAIDYRVLFQNRLHKDFIGDHLGEFCYAGYEQQDSVCDGCPVALAVADGRIHTAERTVEFPDGMRYFEITASPLRDSEGQVIGGIEAVREITDRKRAEAEKENLQAQLLQAQKMEAVGRLAGGVAHDFNNMLGVILGYAELAMQEVADEDPLRASLQEIIIAAKRSSDLTRQLLAFARRQTINPRVLDLNDTVAGLLNMLKRLIGEDIELVWKPEAELSMVKVDPSQIDQVLVNLAVNGRDAIEAVGVMTVETGNATFDEEYCRDHAGFITGDYVMLAVSDNGSGMSAEVRGQLFEPFFTTKETGKGTGLGLAMVYGIIKQNNGFINVYSELGQGTTFRVYLPLAEAEAPLQAGGRERPAGGDETVLIVEDETEILNIARRVLEQAGYSVLSTERPAEALRLAKEHQGAIHLIITDVIMPEINGKDLRDKVVTLRPGVKVLFMSGYTADIIAHQGMLEEGVMVLQKPFSVNELATRVREALDG